MLGNKRIPDFFLGLPRGFLDTSGELSTSPFLSSFVFFRRPGDFFTSSSISLIEDMAERCGEYISSIPPSGAAADLLRRRVAAAGELSRSVSLKARAADFLERTTGE